MPNGRADGGSRPALSATAFYEQLPPTSRTDVTRMEGIEDDDSDRDEPVALPGCVELGFAVELGDDVDELDELELERSWSVPFTSTFLPTRLEKFEALPVKRYDFSLIDELVDPAVLDGLVAVEPVVPVAVDEEEPLDIVASARM